MNRSPKYLLLFVITVLAFFAGVQALGRVLSKNLSDLEPAINGWLVSYDVTLEGTTGGWSQLNPIFTAHRISFSGGWLDEVSLEINLLKSLLYRRVIANRLIVGSAQIAVEYVDSGWRIRGAQGMVLPAVDILSFLIDSRDLLFSAELEAFRHGKSASVVIGARSFNRGGHRRISLILDPDTNCVRCKGRFELDFHESVWGHDDSSGLGLVDLSDVTFDDEVAGILGLPVGKWNVTGGWKKSSKGELFSVEVLFERGKNVDSRFVATASLEGSLHGDRYRGSINLVGLDPLAGRLEFSPLTIDTDARGRLKLFSPVIDFRTLSTFASGLYGLDHPVGRWINGLGASGRLKGAVFLVDQQGTAFAAKAEQVFLNNHRGIPGLESVSGSIRGHGRVIKLDLLARTGKITFPKLFDEPLRFDEAMGPIVFWIGGDYLGMRGDNLRFMADESAIAGGFGLALPRKERNEHQTTVIARVEKMDVRQAKDYVPNGLPGGLKSWVKKNLGDIGSVSGVQLVYQGRNVTRPGLPLRRAELLAKFESVSMDYHQDWPSVSEAHGMLKVGAQEVLINIREATSFETKVSDANISIPSSGSYIDVSLELELPVARALLFAQETPIQRWVPILNSELVGGGSLGISGSLNVPLTGRRRGPGNFKLRIEFNEASLWLEDLRLRLDSLDGAVEYRSPHTIGGGHLSGNLFDTPVDIEVISGTNAGEEFVGVTFAGQIDASNLSTLLGVNDWSVATGIVEYSGNFSIFPDSARPPELTITSDLLGVELQLPDEWAKSRSISRPVDVNIQFLDAYTSVAFRHGRTSGWAHLSGNRLRRGSVGIGAQPLVVSEDEEGLVVTGGVDSLEIDTHVVDSNFPIIWRVSNFRIGTLTASGMEFTNAVVSAHLLSNAIEIQLTSDEIDASVVRKSTNPWLVNIDEIRIPRFSRADKASNSYPLSLDTVGKVVPADVTVGNVLVTDVDGSVDNFGHWRFRIRPHPNGLRVLGLNGAVRGIEITSDQEMFWDRSTNRTRFVGSIEGVQLGSVLPQWNLDLNVESESFRGEGELTWPGSPLALDIKEVEGPFTLEISDGRFVDIEQGGGVARILGLLNYSTFAQRLSGNFSDVLSKGVSFNRIYANVNFQSGKFEFTEPMFVEGNGLLLRVNGTVDLTHGLLDNELVVTLPVSDSLPWYAAYVAIANPVAGVGVLIGRRIFGTQIENLSSGKYRISGTLDDPRVEFDSIFTADMDDSSTSRAQVEKEP